MPFNDAELSLISRTPSSQPQLVSIPVDADQSVIALVKPFDSGRAACIIFAPALRNDTPFAHFKPAFLRKILTTDFALRSGRWKALTLDAKSRSALEGAVGNLLDDLERVEPHIAQAIDMSTPANTASAPDVACTVFKAPESTPFEQALRHLFGMHGDTQSPTGRLTPLDESSEPG